MDPSDREGTLDGGGVPADGERTTPSGDYEPERSEAGGWSLVPPFWPPPGALDWWVLVLAGTWSLLGALGAVALLIVRTGSVEVYSEIHSDGLLFTPDQEDVLELADWVPRPATDGTSFRGLELDSTSFEEAYTGLAGRPPTRIPPDSGSVVVRSLRIWGQCHLRIDRPPRRFLTIWIRSSPAETDPCWLEARLEWFSEGWTERTWTEEDWAGLDWPADVQDQLAHDTFSIGPRVVEPRRAAYLTFVPRSTQTPLAATRIGVRHLGFHREILNQPAHRVYGGLIRLKDFEDRGDPQVMFAGRALGRGFPIEVGDQVQLAGLRSAEIRRLVIGDTIRAFISGEAETVLLDTRDLKPSMLEAWNRDNRLLLVLAAALAFGGATLSIIKAGRGVD